VILQIDGKTSRNTCLSRASKGMAQIPSCPLYIIIPLGLSALPSAKRWLSEGRSARPMEVPGTTVADVPAIRTPETVKAYPVGRYTDPNFPNEMHERHTLYLREQAADWNYRPSQPQALPLGPIAAVSDPSPSNYAAANVEQINAQQKAYAEALLEQNRVMKIGVGEQRSRNRFKASNSFLL
jgi:hypothetical protein